MLRYIRSDQIVKRICRSQIRCILKLENKLYLIVKDSDDENVIFRSKWDCYQGFKYVDEEVPQNILLYARKVIDLNFADSTRYPLKGEWYVINEYSRDGSMRWKLRKIREKESTTSIVAISWLLQFMVAMIIGGLILAWTMSYAQEWLYSFLPNLDRTALGQIYIVIECAVCTALFLLFKEYRDIFDFCFNAFIPLGLVIIAGLSKCYWWMCIVIPVAFGLIGALFAVWEIFIEEYEPTYSKCTRMALGILSIVLFMVTSLGGINAYSHSGKTVDHIELSFEEAQKQHRVDCCSLEGEIWGTLSIQEKVDLLQIICDYECKYVLGCEPVVVYSGLTSRESVCGEFSSRTRSIVISEQYLQNSDVEDVVETALHETRHAYQHSLVEMYFSLETQIKDEYKNLFPFQQAKSFAEEFEDYCTGDEDFNKYHAQSVEKDSREWAEQRVEEYYIFFIYPEQ